MQQPIYRCILVREGKINPDWRTSSSKQALAVANDMLGDCPDESLVVILLDTKHHVLGASIVGTGTLDSALVHPRSIFRAAIAGNAASIIVAHNHPSGDCTPSKQDIEVHSRLKRAGNIVGIEVLDHLVVDGLGNGTSLEEYIR